MTIRAVSLFCGAGGFCEGARLAGWQVVSAVESDAQACRTHAANFPEVKLHEGDIAGFLKGRRRSHASRASGSTLFTAALPARVSAKSAPAISPIRAMFFTRNLFAYAGRQMRARS